MRAPLADRGHTTRLWGADIDGARSGRARTALSLSIDQSPNLGPFSGQLGEVRIWSTARTAAEIKAAMHKELVGNETGLFRYWKFQDGAGTTIRDRTAAVNHLTTNVGANGTGAFWVERP